MALRKESPKGKPGGPRSHSFGSAREARCGGWQNRAVKARGAGCCQPTGPAVGVSGRPGAGRARGS